MRIIAGKHKGRKLKELKVDGVRPTLDRVRESVFNILYPRVEGSSFLDLFTGSGAVGFEALSRGAKKVVFADSSRQVTAHVKDCATMLKESVTVINADYKSVLKRLSGNIFDFIYVDPPYDFLGEEVLAEIAKSDLLGNDTVVIYEHKSENPLKNYEQWFIIDDERKYGIATLSFLRKKDD